MVMEYFRRWRGCLDGLTTVEKLCMIYLALPVAVFYLGWLNFWVGVPAAILLIVSAVPLPKRGEASGLSGFTVTSLIVVAALAVLWTCLGGAGHLFYSNTDWVVRDAVLRDLVTYQWPVNYSRDVEDLILLRAPIGYYLIPALIAKVTGLASADFLLLAWTALGVILFFLAAAPLFKKPSMLYFALGVFIFFSGMDILGNLYLKKPLDFTTHLEWWNITFQYSSMTTVLFWVPNHGLPGWLAAAMILRNWENIDFTPAAFIVTSLVPLWSPLTAIGVAIIATAFLVNRFVRKELGPLLNPLTLVVCLLALPVAVYLTLKMRGVVSAAVYDQVTGNAPIFLQYIQLVIIDLTAALFILAGEFRYRTPFKWLTLTAFVGLLALPGYYMGPGNDFVMRASIPLLAVIALRAPALLKEFLSNRAYALLCVTGALLLMGAMTPLFEIDRAVARPRWKPNPYANLLAATNMNAPHYLCVIKSADLPGFLRMP